ncbi:MAG TPA: 1,2-phenylacetyl-CoA epoxidase subunit PaaC [Micromonosporaceae bacterium]
MSEPTDTDLIDYTLRLGDDALISAQRLGEWSAAAPEMEEDIALSNIALDQLGVARLLLTYAGALAGTGQTEDDLAYLREDRGFRNCLLVELPNAGPAAAPGAPGDFGITMAKLLFAAAYQLLTYEWLAQSSGDERLSAVAAKASKESRYHLDHASVWTVRLGDGTAESHRRMQAAVDDLWPYTHELFADDPVIDRLADRGVAPRPSSLRPRWLEISTGVLTEATLTMPEDGWAPHGGRSGRHTEHLSYLLAEMQVLHRAHPGARW